MYRLTPELEARMDEHIKNRPPNLLLLQEPELRVKLTGKIADAAKANPASVQVRVTAEGEDGITVLDRPTRVDVLDVIKIDESLVAMAHRYDCPRLTSGAEATGSELYVMHLGGKTMVSSPSW